MNQGSGPLAELRNAHKSFGPVKALSGLDLAIHPGQVTAVLGPNGAGKTTAVNLMMGLLKPDQGQALLFGRGPQDPRSRMKTGVMLQVSGVPETLKVKEHIRLFSSYYPNPLPPEQVLAIAGLEGLEHRYFGKLSGGQKQRLLFALAVCGRPELMFLDEPTVGLDVEARRGMWREIKSLVQQGTGVALTTHYLEEADFLADRIVIVDKGVVVAQGTPAEIKTLTANKRIRCASQLSQEELMGLPGVSGVKKNGEQVSLLSSAAEDTTRRLLAMDPELKHLEVVGAGLEEAFLNLTHERKEEEAAA